MELFKDFGIWKIVGHIALKFYSGACETFSTPSTLRFRRRQRPKRGKSVGYWRSLASGG